MTGRIPRHRRLRLTGYVLAALLHILKRRSDLVNRASSIKIRYPLEAPITVYSSIVDVESYCMVPLTSTRIEIGCEMLNCVLIVLEATPNGSTCQTNKLPFNIAAATSTLPFDWGTDYIENCSDVDDARRVDVLASMELLNRCIRTEGSH